MKDRYNNQELLDDMYARDNCIPIVDTHTEFANAYDVIAVRHPAKHIREQYAMRHGAKPQ